MDACFQIFVESLQVYDSQVYKKLEMTNSCNQNIMEMLMFSFLVLMQISIHARGFVAEVVKLEMHILSGVSIVM